MVLLVPGADAEEDRDRLVDRRLLDHDRLEAPLERRILLDVLAVLVEGGGADALQLAPGEWRLEDVGSIDRALCRSCSHQGVELVDEQDVVVAAAQLLDDLLEALLELAAVLGACDHRADVQSQDDLVHYRPRTLVAHDPIVESLL